jgi:hypothetical protein
MLIEQHPKTWYASYFDTNDSAQTVLIGQYNEDELIQEAETRGAIKELQKQKDWLIGQMVATSKLDTRDLDYAFGHVYKRVIASIDEALFRLGASRYEETEEIQ